MLYSSNSLRVCDTAMSNALNATGRRIFFRGLRGAVDVPATWMGSVANTWRTAYDIENDWSCVTSHVDWTNVYACFAVRAGSGELTKGARPGPDDPGAVQMMTSNLQFAQQSRTRQQQLPAERLKAQGTAAYKIQDYEQAVAHYKTAAAEHGAEPKRRLEAVHHGLREGTLDLREGALWTVPPIHEQTRIGGPSATLQQPESYLPLCQSAMEGNVAKCLIMLERFKEAALHARASLALTAPGSKVHANSMRRLLKANTALAHKRLALAKALHDRLGAESPLTEHLTERELLQTIAETAGRRRPGMAEVDSIE